MWAVTEFIEWLGSKQLIQVCRYFPFFFSFGERSESSKGPCRLAGSSEAERDVTFPVGGAGLGWEEVELEEGEWGRRGLERWTEVMSHWALDAVLED